MTRARFWTYTYDYYTPMPPLNWQLKSAQKTILGHPVRLATVTYGGRTWNAWYAVDLKMPFGPYVFYGLPGLILEMTDTETNFHFIATRISTAPQRIYKRHKNALKSTTKAAYYKLEEKFYANPHAVNSNVFIAELPYNPIEWLE